jgi:hypothetical protein
MKTPKILIHLAGGALVAMAASSLSSACSSNSAGNPAPTPEDGGNDVASSSSSGSGGSSGSSGGGGSSSGSSSGGLTDGPTPIDTGNCQSDSSVCNSCYSDAQAAQDPYNACSAYAVNCTKFDNTRVPLNDGGVPPVP